MQLKEIDQIKPGMFTVDDVVNSQNNVLIEKDKKITEKHLAIFKTWGITALHVKSCLDEEIESNLTPAQLEIANKIIDQKMILNTEEHPFLESLRTLLLARFEANPHLLKESVE